MKIFSRGTESATPPVAATVTTAPAPKAATPTTNVASAPSAPAQDLTLANPDLSAIIEANVKEMSEKIARLASTLDGDHSERAEFESKIEKMEERMRKLSSLTEMISAQYNPFVGAAPSERESMPTPDVGLAMPPLAMSSSPAPAVAAVPQLVTQPPPPLGLDDPFATVSPELDSALTDTPEGAPAPPPEIQAIAPDVTDAAVNTSDERTEIDDVRLWSVRPSFGASMLMLNWADMLLKHAPSREGVQQMLEYYRNVGWLGEPARDQLLAYIDGIAHGPEGEPERDWRASIEVHEKSLLFIEKLRVLRGD
ncbi:MAG: FlaD/FlaE family flagellar protein [Candidatus Thermoplasmatota archaeon]